MTMSAQTPPDAAAPQVNDRKPGNRNALVIAVVVIALGLMAWAGIKNYQRRKQDEAKLKEMQAMVVKLSPSDAPPGAPPPAAQPGDDTPDANPLAGKSAPNFTLKDTSGKKVSLAGYKGKAVIIDFWATWCAPCKVEIPWLEKLHDQYSAQGLEILGVSEDDLDLDDQTKLLKEKQDIANSAVRLRINYPVLIDDSNVAKPYGGIDALPTTFFVGRDGKVVATTIGLADRDEIEANIKKALSSGAPPAGGQS